MYKDIVNFFKNIRVYEQEKRRLKKKNINARNRFFSFPFPKDNIHIDIEKIKANGGKFRF